MRFPDALLDGSHFLRRQWMIVLGAPLVGAGLGALCGWAVAPASQYQSAATIRFSAASADVSPEYGTAAGAASSETVVSLNVAEEVALRFNMIPTIGDPEMRKASPYLSIVQAVQQRIRAQSVPGGIVLAATADRPDAAAQMAGAAAEAWLNERKRWRDQAWVGAKRIYEAQLVGADHRLREAEQDLREFREREGPVLYAEEAKAMLDAIVWLEREQEEMQRGKAEGIRLEQPAKVRGIQAQETVLARQLAKARERYARLPKAASELARLERAIKVEAEAYESLKSRIEQQVQIGARLQNEPVEVEPALVPKEPLAPLCLRAWIMGGGAIGFLLGLATGFWREASATSLRAIEGLQASLKLPVLGVLPRYRERTLRRRVEEQYAKSLTPEGLSVIANLFAIGAPHSLQAEGIRSVQANLEFAVGDTPAKVLTVTSAGINEGKTLTAVNLALSLAHEGRRVLLVDADFTRPRVHERLGLSRDPGLADVLRGTVPWRSAVQSVADLMLGPLGVDPVLQSPRMDNLSVLPAGSRTAPQSPVQVARLGLLLRELKDEYDVVLVDTPAILPLLDGVRLSAKADGAILVFQGGAGGFPTLRRAKFLLDHARAKVLGLVLTNVGPEALPEPSVYRYDVS